MFDPSPTYYELQAIGFATGAALCCMLGVLQLRIDRVERISSHYPRLWLICLAWNVGYFLQCTLILAGHSPTSRSVSVAALLAWCAITGGTSYLLLTVQRSLQLPAVLKRVPLFVSTIASAAIVILFVVAVFAERPSLPFYSVIGLSFANAVAHWTASGLLFLVHRRSVRVEQALPHQKIWFKRIIFSAILLLTLQTFAYFTGDAGGWIHIIARTIAEQWSIPLVVVMAAFLADSIYADVVLKRTLRLLVCVCVAAVLMYLSLGKDSGLLMVFATIAVAALLFCAPWFKQKMDAFVDTVLLKRPDYDAIAARFSEQVSHAAGKEEVVALMQATTRDALRHRAALDPALTMDIPLATYTPAPDSVSQLFMQGELTFLRTIAKEASRRLDVLANEVERREAKLREERLRHAITEADLIALRAQVNPHFLFNTLNSIAELISSAPLVAESMTERLANFFRYTLTRARQPLSTLDEELEFTRHYLEIEKARFGERLHCEVNFDHAVSEAKIPSLLLQPLVENAIRHGIAPKLAGGALRVTARREAENVRILVEDDGVGMPENQPTTGTGLQNVRERLRLLYGDRGSMTIGAGKSGLGTSVTLLIPSHAN